MRTKKNLEKFFRDVFALAKQVYSGVTAENSQTERVRVSDNKALKKLRAELLRRAIWSSSELSDRNAWAQSFDDGGINYDDKNYTRYVRPVLVLKY